MSTIIATVTGIGPDSTVPDNAGAVDFRVTSGDLVFEVTLLPSHTGQLSEWGSPENWISNPALLDVLDASDIVAACRAAL